MYVRSGLAAVRRVGKDAMGDGMMIDGDRRRRMQESLDLVRESRVPSLAGDFDALRCDAMEDLPDSRWHRLERMTT